MNSKAAPVKAAGRPRTLNSVADAVRHLWIARAAVFQALSPTTSSRRSGWSGTWSRPGSGGSWLYAQIADGTILAVYGDLPRPAFLDVAPGGDILRERGEAQGSEEAHRRRRCGARAATGTGIITAAALSN